MGKRRRFGELELEVLREVQRRGEASVQQVQKAIGGSYTTVMTVMSRLFGKGALVREKVGRLYEYSLAKPRQSHAGKAAAIISYFIDETEELSYEDLEEMERLIQQAKRRAKDDI